METDTGTIKAIICSNFDSSPKHYDSFEREHGLFGYLTRELARVSGVKEGMTVYDIGCGTGASTITLAELVGNDGRVIGIDFSEPMLDAARAKVKDSGTIEFMACDAVHLKENAEVDAILFNASIFLMPDMEQALEAAFDVLGTGGVVGMNWLRGVFDQSGETDLFRLAKEEGLHFAPYGRGVADMATLPGILKRVGYVNLQEGDTPIEMTFGQVKDFYSIPAQSAGLYPKTPYEERAILLDGLLDHISGQGHRTLCQSWGWQAGRK
jgi:SAM-dependent methyltransferase